MKNHNVAIHFLLNFKTASYICSRKNIIGRIIMKILLTNDDGYRAKGIREMAALLKNFGEVTVIAPKRPQSGMSMAVSMGGQALAYKNLGTEDGIGWAYLDATPASCVKLALNTVFLEEKPDVVVSGINHGTNAASAVCYSGTLGAAAEAALNGITAIGVSMDTSDPEADFSEIRKRFPEIFTALTENPASEYGIYYNINFPGESCREIKGVRVASQGYGRWVREFRRWDADFLKRRGKSPEEIRDAMSRAEDGEELYVIVGDFEDDPRNPEDADHRLNRDGYITVVPHNINCTDYQECKRLEDIGLNINY